MMNHRTVRFRIFLGLFIVLFAGTFLTVGLLFQTRHTPQASVNQNVVNALPGNFQPGINAVIAISIIVVLIVLFLILMAFEILRRNQIEESLRESEATLRTLVNANPESLFLINTQGTILAANDVMARRLGKSLEEVVGVRFDHLMIAEMAESWRAYVEDIIQTRQPVQFEDACQGRYFSNYIQPILNKEGQVIRLAFLTQDITKRKRAEQELHSYREHLEILVQERAAELAEERNLLRTLIDNMPDLILIKDTESRFLAMNQALARMMGATTPGELLGKTDFDFYPQDIAQQYYTLERVILESGRPSLNQEELHFDPETGEECWFLATKIPFRDQQGVIRGLVGISRDITERKQIEAELRQHRDRLEDLVKARTTELTAANEHLRQEIIERTHAEQLLAEERVLLRTLIDHIPDYIYVKDPASRFLIANPATVRLMGAATANELLGKTDFDFYPKDLAAQYSADERRIMASGHALINYEEPVFNNRTRDTQWILTSKIPFRDRHGNLAGLVGIGRDITDRKRVEEKIRHLNADLEQRVHERTAELEAANKELQSFAYVASHDLKAPLRAIAKLVQWLVEDYAGSFDAKGKEMTDLLVGRVKRMDALIDGILEYSRIGRIVKQAERIDLNRLLPDIIDSLAPPPSIQIDIAPELPVIVGDSTRIQQVFANLIGNALKFMDKPEGTIAVGCENAGEFWQFSVTDNGPGIEPQHYERIFQIFQTLTSRDEMENTGIGLTIVKKIVEGYGSKIWVESIVGQRTTFYFTFPKNQ